MITTHLRNLLTAVICIFAGATAQAQFTGGVEQYPTSDYRTKAVKFNLTEVATAVGTDAATLAEAFNAWQEAEEAEENLFFLVNADGTLNDAYSADGKGFYITSEGAAGVWARDDAATAGTWFASPSADAEAGEFAISVGQYPDTLVAGDKVSAKFALVYGGKQATFEVSLSVIAKPEIPAPTTLVEKDLNIVGEKEVTVEQFPRSGYDSDNVEIEIGDAVAKLGFENAELLSDVLGDVLYCTVFNTGDIEEGGGLKVDTLTNESSAGAPGFWLHAVQNENGEETGECSRAPYGGEDKFFVEAFAFNAETGVISCKLGQYPGNVKANEQWWVNVYLLRGDKAYRLKYTLKLNEREQGSGLEGMNKVGEVSYEFEQIPTSGYEAISFSVDVEAVAAALGCEVGSFSLQGLDDSDNWASSTANNGGFWMNDAGRVVSYSAGAMYIEPATSNDYSVLHIGQYPNHFAVDDVWEGELYFVNGDNYYTLKAKMKIVPEEIPDQSKFKVVATRNAIMQLVAVNAYEAEQTTYIITPDEMKEFIGTSSPVMYAEAKDEDKEATGQDYVAFNYKGYHCTPDPGVWLNQDGKAAGWANTSPVGICYDLSSGEFTLYQYPNANSIGDVYKANLYFVNTESENEWPMLQVKFTITFVSEIATFEEVGSQDVVLPVSMEKDCVIDFDLAPAAEALGVTVDELSAESNRYLKGMAGGAYSEGVNIETGLGFDANGDCNSQGDYYFYFEDGKMYTVTSTDIPEDFSLPVQFAFNIDNKIYVYYANFVSEAVYSGIKTVGNEAKADNRIFDISGRQVTKPTRGLYIQNGKKVVIK